MPCVEGAPDCLASGWTANEFFAKLAVWSLGALVYTYASSKVLPRTDFNGSPKYNWLSCLPIQLVGFPLVFYLAVASFEGSFVAWLSAPWAELSGPPERCYLMLIYAYMFKDLGLYLLGARMDTMYWAHHLGCWVIILQFFWNESPGIFICGATAMEFGGASQTLHLLSPESATWDWVHVATMTLSHVASCSTSLYYSTIPPTALWIRVLFTALVFVLSQQRQAHAMTLHRAFVARRAKRGS